MSIPRTSTAMGALQDTVVPTVLDKRPIVESAGDTGATEASRRSS